MVTGIKNPIVFDLGSRKSTLTLHSLLLRYPSAIGETLRSSAKLNLLGSSIQRVARLRKQGELVYMLESECSRSQLSAIKLFCLNGNIACGVA